MKSLKILFVFLLAAAAAVAQQSVSFQSLQPHPRLFISKSCMAAINNQSDSVTKQLKAVLKMDAEQRLTASPIVYPNDISNFGTSRNVQGRIISLALAYRFFGDKRYCEKAKKELLQLAAVGNWGTSHFLDVGEASTAAAIGYDWLYNDLTAAERKTVADAIKTKALIPGIQSNEQTDTWVNGNFNWNPVCNGGLAMGALAIAEEEPTLAKQVVDRAIRNLPSAGAAYSPDGSFAEGPSYWSYGTTFYILTVEALRSALGNSYGLEKVPGFLKTADFTLQMKAPSGEKFNYSDYHPDYGNEPVMLWFAKENNRADLAEKEVSDIAHLHQQWQHGVPAGEKRFTQSRHTPLELLWWKPTLLSNQNGATTPVQWTASGEMPISIMRTSWNDPLASFVAIKGGTPNNSHGHMDAGSFILEIGGVRWALDLGTESYDKMRAAKLDLWNYTQNSNRWTTFRAGPEGHNILRFDGGRQLIAGKGEVVQLPKVAGTMGAEADLTSLYANKAKEVKRRVLLHPDNSISIQDSWVAKDSAVTVSFQWLTKAAVTKTANGLELQQGGKTLNLVIEGPQEGVTIDVQDVSKSTAVQDSDNPGLSRIVINTKTEAGATGSLKLKAYQKQ